MSLTIGLVTRGRPELLSYTLGKTVANIRGDTRLIVLADEDDERMRGFSFPGAEIDFRAREDSIGAKWNRMHKLAPADVYMVMVDHSPMLTEGFDLKVMEAAKIFPDGIGGVYDHLFCMSFPHINAATSKMVELMGGMYPTHFPYWFVDHWFDDICRMIGRFVFCDVVCDSSKRPGTQDQREPWLWGSLYDALYREREEVAERLLSHMDEPEWRKDMLRRNFPLVHERSRYINSLLRGNEGTDKSRDERYLRIREAGISKIANVYKELA